MTNTASSADAPDALAAEQLSPVLDRMRGIWERLLGTDASPASNFFELAANRSWPCVPLPR